MTADALRRRSRHGRGRGRGTRRRDRAAGERRTTWPSTGWGSSAPGVRAARPAPPASACRICTPGATWPAARCEIVALADVKRENAEAFRSDQGIPDARLFEDYREMLARGAAGRRLGLHLAPPARRDGGRRGRGRGEGDPLREADGAHVRRGAADARRVRRAGRAADLQPPAPLRGAVPHGARRCCGEGAVGEVVQIQTACPNLFDWGTHWFDMLFYYNAEIAGDLGAGADRRPGAADGLRGADGGPGAELRRLPERRPRAADHRGYGRPGAPGGPTGQRATLGAAQRIIGTAGVLEVAAPGSRLRLLNGAAPGGRRCRRDDAGPGGHREQHRRRDRRSAGLPGVRRRAGAVLGQGHPHHRADLRHLRVRAGAGRGSTCPWRSRIRRC